MMLWLGSDAQIYCYGLYHFGCRLVVFCCSLCINELGDSKRGCQDICKRRMLWWPVNLTGTWRTEMPLWFEWFWVWTGGIQERIMHERVGRFRILKKYHARHVTALMPWWCGGDLTSKYPVMICITYTVGWLYSTKVCVWTSWQITFTEVSLCSACIYSNAMKIWRRYDVQISRYKMYHFYCWVMIFYKSVSSNELADYFNWGVLLMACKQNFHFLAL